MIATVTLNPAIDKTNIVNNFEIGKVNRISDSRDDVGGKGINVSKAIHELGGETLVLGFVGGENGNRIQKYLWELGIDYDFSYINQNTRVNIKIVDPVNGTTTDINDGGLPITDKPNIQKLERKILERGKAASFVVMSGSMPPEFDKSFYYKMAEQLCEYTKVVIDCEGEALLNAVKAAPFLIKPNKSEFMRTFSLAEDADDETVVKFAFDVIDEFKLGYILLSLGKDGSILVSKDCAYKSEPIAIDVKSAVGPGDAMLGGFLYAYEKYRDEEKALTYASACGTAAVMTEGTKSVAKADVDSLLKRFTINKLPFRR